MIKQLLRCALEEQSAGRQSILVTVTQTQGSTPGKTGSMMLVGGERRLCGTIGGGNLEHWCVGHAAEQAGRHSFFRLDNASAAEYGMICGGSTWVLFTPIQAGAPLEQAIRALEERRSISLLLPLDGGSPQILWEEELRQPRQLERDGTQYFAVPLSSWRNVYLLGGGHVASAFARTLDFLGFPYYVWDDRADFSNPERFPKALGAFSSPAEDLGQVFSGPLSPGKEDIIYIMTRGHLSDADALRYALSTPVSHIGLIGSRRKREHIFSQLAQWGFPDGAQRVTIPVGLPIGAQTPEEIAISISAQLIGWRYGVE